jgi:hypothetical protein
MRLFGAYELVFDLRDRFRVSVYPINVEFPPLNDEKDQTNPIPSFVTGQRPIQIRELFLNVGFLADCRASAALRRFLQQFLRNHDSELEDVEPSKKWALTSNVAAISRAVSSRSRHLAV